MPQVKIQETGGCVPYTVLNPHRGRQLSDVCCRQPSRAREPQHEVPSALPPHQAAPRWDPAGQLYGANRQPLLVNPGNEMVGEVSRWGVNMLLPCLYRALVWTQPPEDTPQDNQG